MSTQEALAIKPYDPMLHDIDLRSKAVFYPAGFPVNIATNSRDVLEAAAESWGMYAAPEFATAPLEIRVIVQPEGGLAETPQYRTQGQLFSAISDRHNFAAFDSKSMSGFSVVSQRTAAHHLALRMHFLEGMVYMLLAQRYVVPMHAACLARNGSGVLLCGRSSAGKSTLAYGCARAGWTYVADDCTWLLPDSEDRVAVGRSHIVRFRDDAPRLFPELEGYVTHQYPNGKLTIEVPLADFPRIRTAWRCPVDRVVLLDRQGGGAPRIEKVCSEAMVERLLGDMPSYGEEVNSMYARTLGRLLTVPAFSMRYQTLDDAMSLLAELAIS
ncbi:MAG TPA: hypothetical protein VE959_04920 [Bryobacteraceae bacterium]|nr:hypothetical protein [Bryobacteraceae bacterium]